MSGYYRFFKAKPTHDDRVRRQLGPTGVGIGILAMYDVETLSFMVGQMQDRQNSLVTQMESLTTDTAKLAKHFKKLQGAVDMIMNLEVSTSHFLKIEIQQVAVMAERYFSGLSSLMDGKLNVDMWWRVENLQKSKKQPSLKVWRRCFKISLSSTSFRHPMWQSGARSEWS